MANYAGEMEARQLWLSQPVFWHQSYVLTQALCDPLTRGKIDYTLCERKLAA